jgi:hypothetical protein
MTKGKMFELGGGKNFALFDEAVCIDIQKRKLKNILKIHYGFLRQIVTDLGHQRPNFFSSSEDATRTQNEKKQSQRVLGKNYE